jgi:hypothetical protein
VSAPLPTLTLIFAALLHAPAITGVTPPEGPVFDHLYFVNYQKNGCIGKRAADGTLSVWATFIGI